MAIILDPPNDLKPRTGTLDQLSDVVEMVDALSAFIANGTLAPVPAGQMYCPRCGDIRE